MTPSLYILFSTACIQTQQLLIEKIKDSGAKKRQLLLQNQDPFEWRH